MIQKLSNLMVVDFWSGNRSAARQEYEREVLGAILKASEEKWGAFQIKEQLTTYSSKLESQAFSKKDHDVLVTVAGNLKFKDVDKIVIDQPITKNLLGYRVLIIRDKDEAVFSKITSTAELQELKMGIPETWSDAGIFRHNNFKVVEKGSFDSIFEQLQNKEFDYCTFGANEVIEIFTNRASKYEGLVLEKNLLLFYPFPLVFYVHPKRPKIAQRIEEGLEHILASKTLDFIFNKHYGNVKEELKLAKRKLIRLDNPLIADEFRDFTPDLNAW